MKQPANSLQNAATSSQLKSAVDSLPRHEKYYTEHVIDLLVAKNNLIVDTATADSVVKFLHSFSFVEFHAPLLQTKQARDLVINRIAPHVTAIYEFGGLICNIVQDPQSSMLFCNFESFSAILKCFHRSETSDDVRGLASSFYNILYFIPYAKKLLNSLPVVEAFSFIIPLAKHTEAVHWIWSALEVILENNEEAQKKFTTPEFFKMFQGMGKHATTYASKKSLQNIIGLHRSV
jgi:hypothetical protein